MTDTSTALEKTIAPQQTEEDSAQEEYRPFRDFLRRMAREKFAMAGLFFVLLLGLVAIYAPFLSNAKPFLTNFPDGHWRSPAFFSLFAPDSQEIFVEKVFNYLALALPLLLLLFLCFRARTPRSRSLRRWIIVAMLALLTLPFLLSGAKMTQQDWREIAARPEPSGFTVILTPIPFGPYETSSDIYRKPSSAHWFGTDQVGRDVLARMIYGTRVALAVGFFATLLSMLFGVTIGLLSGYLGGKFDLIVQRLVEIVICFPTFLLLLILMAIMLDYGARQSILLVIVVLGLTGWTGLCRLVRGETLKQRQFAYIQSCEAMGLPLWRILLFHLLPNVSGPIFVSFAFDVAGAILAENGLSFLGFGVQDPTSSWGDLLRQAFSDPLQYWNLMLWPGLAIFLSVCSFNFIADALRKSIDLKR